MNIEVWFPFPLTGLISFHSKGLSRVFSSTTIQKHQFFGSPLSLWSLSYPYMNAVKAIALTIQTFVSSHVQFSCSVVSNSLWPCSMPGLPVHHQLPESTQTHVHQVGDAIQPSHPLLSPSPPALNPSQHQGLFKWVSSSHQVAKVLEFQLQPQTFQWTPRTDLL